MGIIKEYISYRMNAKILIYIDELRGTELSKCIKLEHNIVKGLVDR